MSRDGGFQAVRAAGKNLQIHTLFFEKTCFIAKISRLFDDMVESTLLAGGRWKFRGFSSRTGKSRICSCVHHGPAWSCNMYVCVGTVSQPHRPTDLLVAA